MAKGMAEPHYMSRSEMLNKLSTSALPHTTREELEILTQYIHESNEDEEHLADFDFLADERTSSSAASVSTVKQRSEVEQNEEERSQDFEDEFHEDELYDTSFTSESSCSCESCEGGASSDYSSCSCLNHEDSEDPMSSMMTSGSNVTTIEPGTVENLA